jgi:nuclear cap-binding protein subunit 1
MADYERRNSNYRGGGGRKRRYRGEYVSSFRFTKLTIQFADDEDYDRRPQRRRYEEPLFVQVRRQLLTLAESVRSFFRALRSLEYWAWILMGDNLSGCSTR